MSSVPPGIGLLQTLRGNEYSRNGHRILVLALTFLAYTCYHVSRRPLSIVKNVLESDSLPLHSDPQPWPSGPVFHEARCVPSDSASRVGLGWSPFDGTDGTAKLGEIDVAFLTCYAIGTFAAGRIGDRVNLRHFVTAGMIGSGATVVLFGMGYFWNIHAFRFYLAVQMLSGLLQSTGWPSMVAVVGNWLDEQRRGLIMGIWNAHTSIGNIIGSLLAASVLQNGWGWSFILPGAVVALCGILVFLFLVPDPEDVGLPRNQRQHPNGAGNVATEQQVKETEEGDRRPVGILTACSIPGVIPYALCLFFAKFVANTFVYWLPFYLSQTAVGGQFMSVKAAGNLSTLFDVGGMMGGILAGFMSDQFQASAITAATFMFAAIPSLYLYYAYGGVSRAANVVLLIAAGFFINGPCALISTAVSADLGTHQTLAGNARALATVSSIIDGTGSVGGALGPLVTGFLSRRGWASVFVVLILLESFAGVILCILGHAEIRAIIQRIKIYLGELRQIILQIRIPLTGLGRTIQAGQDSTCDHPQQQESADSISTPLITQDD